MNNSDQNPAAQPSQVSAEQSAEIADRIVKKVYVCGAHHEQIVKAIILELAAPAAAPPQLHSDDWWWEIIDAAIGQWGGQQRQHFAEAISRIKDVFNKRIAGLDEFGMKLEAEATPAAVEGQLSARELAVWILTNCAAKYVNPVGYSQSPQDVIDLQIHMAEVKIAEAYASSSRAAKPSLGQKEGD